MKTLERKCAILAGRRHRPDLILPEELHSDTVTASVYDNTPNSETLAAVREARDILSGKIAAKSYSSVEELNRELDAEYEAEYGPEC
jgi:hypothetical protein